MNCQVRSYINKYHLQYNGDLNEPTNKTEVFTSQPKVNLTIFYSN